MERYESPEIINVGCGEDVTIAELAALIVATSSASKATLVFDRSKPDGTPRKLLDVGKITRARLASRERARATASARPTTGTSTNWRAHAPS